MRITEATNQQEWDSFLSAQQYSPFLQSWTMGEVYRDVGEEPVRLEMRDGGELVGICQALIVPARRGKHLAIPYGPVLKSNYQLSIINSLLKELTRKAQEYQCAFIRLSPFWPSTTQAIPNTKPSPLHLLAEHIWYLSLTTLDPWCANSECRIPNSSPQDKRQGQRSEDEILAVMRQNHRNLIRRAEREGVLVEASSEPMKDIEEFFRLYDETRKRHHFVPYPAHFIRSQVERFSIHNECTLYLARYNNEVIAASMHMHFGGETSYHHGASTNKYPKVPASYALQWRAIQDALERGDHIFNFWGISPEGVRKHPFAGVRTFKTGFGGELLELIHCMDIPVTKQYYITRAFETWRKWKRGF